MKKLVGLLILTALLFVYSKMNATTYVYDTYNKAYKSAETVLSPVIPADAPTGSSFRNKYYAFLKQHILEPYEEQNSARGKQVRYVDEVLKAAARLKSAKSPEFLICEGHELFNANPKDIVLSFAYAYSCKLNNKYSVTADVLGANYNTFIKSTKHGLLLKYLYFSALYYARSSTSQITGDEWSAAYNAMRDGLTSHTFAPGQERIIYYLMCYNVKSWNHYRKLLIHHNFDPWIINMITGRMEKDKAWENRGGGWASSVSDKGWNGFKHHMEKANTAFTQAWMRHNDWPEAATAMISVAMTGNANEGDTVYLWFKRAVEVEADYTRAYEKLFWALRPRWGGSFEQILHLGTCALDTNRFDTEIPFAYLHALFSISADLPGYKWRMIFRDPQIIKHLDIMMDKLEQNAASSFKKERFKAMRGIFQMFRGNYAKANALIQSVDKRVNFEFIFPEWVTGLYFSKEYVKAEIRVGLSNPALINSAYQDLHADKNNAAVAKFEKLCSNIDKSDKTALEFLTNEIGYTLLNIKRIDAASGMSALIKCISERDYATYKKLIELGAPLSGNCDARKIYPLMNAAQFSKKNINFLKLALSTETEVNDSSTGGWTPLLCATRYGTLEAQELLLKAGAKHTNTTNQGMTPLNFAAEERDINFVKMLIANGADVNSCDLREQTPLINSMSNKHSSQIAPYLINHGAEVNSIDHKGKTALFYAVEKVKPDMVALLLKNGADTNLRDHKRRSVLDLAKEVHNKKNNAETRAVYKILSAHYNGL